MKNIAQQPNGYDCGPYSCLFAMNAYRNLPIPKVFDGQIARKKIFLEIYIRNKNGIIKSIH